MGAMKDLYNAIYEVDFSTDDLMTMVQEVNGWDGRLDYLEFYNNDDDFFNLFFEGRPAEAVRASYYGDYHYMDEFVRFNAYANLESLSAWQVEKELQESKADILDAYLDIGGSSIDIVQRVKEDTSIKEEDRKALIYLLEK